jgi:protein-L-isoaspartate(D-aspartate) O-methyltransferase
MTDSWRHKGMRRNLIKTLKEKGISDAATLEVMGKLPRHFFLDKAFEEHAYEDKAFPIGSEQTISQPFTVAYMTQLLAVKTGEKILEIGTGSGYQAAVLAMLGAVVFTIERQESLFQKTKQLLLSLNLPNIHCFFKDGSKGLSANAPFDKIIVTAGAPVVPDALKNQLKIGGRLVIPVGGDAEQRMLVIDRKSDLVFEEKWLETFRFVPFLGGIVEK